MIPSVNEDKIDFVKKWCLKAEHDLQTAINERAVQNQDILTDTICYHCQQAVEKYLKAFLVWHEVDFKKVHDLVYLKELCSKIDEGFSDIRVTRLTTYAVSLRYPDDFYMPSLDETDEAITLARRVRELVRSKLEYIFTNK